MDQDRITLTIEGPASEDGHVRLVDFVSQLRALSTALLQIERLLGGSQAYYRIVALRHSSPASVVMERVTPRFRGAPKPKPAIPAFLGALKEIEEDKAPDADRKLLSSLKLLSAPVGKTVRSTLLTSNGDAMQVTPALRAKVEVLLAPETSSRGSVMGMLERINFHASANTFHLYPMIGPQRIACRFPVRLTDKAELAVNKYVRVLGELRYKSSANFPHTVEVSDIEIMPQDKHFPTLIDLRGIAPNATDGEEAVEFIWRVRNEW